MQSAPQEKLQLDNPFRKERTMSDFVIGAGRYLLITGGSLTLIFVYVLLCGAVSKRWPKLGFALLGVVGAGFVTLFSFAGMTVIGVTNGTGWTVLVPIYVVVLICWVVFAFRQRGTRSQGE